MAAALPLEARTDLAGYVQVMEDDGYAYFPGMLNEVEVSALREAMDKLMAIEESYDRHTDPAEQSIMCKAGNCVVFHCEVWHRGTPNTSGRTRYLLQVHYAQSMITQKYPPYLNKF